jgi:hypothetical protein
MKALLGGSSSPYAVTAQLPPDLPTSPHDSSEPIPPKRGKKPNGAPPDSEGAQPGGELPESASPPPPPAAKVQKVNRKLDLASIRKARAEMTATVGESSRIPVTDSPSSAYFLRAHPTFGGLDDPLPLWKREGIGKGGGGLLLVKPHMVEKIRAHGGKAGMYGAWWCKYSLSGQVLVVASIESDNDWIVSARGIYEMARAQWVKRINDGNCWRHLFPPAAIPDPLFEDYEWDDVINLGWDDEVDEKHPAFLDLLYGGHAPKAKK